MGNDLSTILKLSRLLKLLSILKAALTVGIIGFTVFKIIVLFKQKE